jgi:cytoskeletal protein RodZ
MGMVGEKLRAAREKSNRTIREYSDLTKIRSDHLQALEEGRYDSFSAPVYIRGFVRSYASALKLNIPEILSELDEELAQTERFREPPRLTGERHGILDYIMLQLSKINWSVAFPLLLLALILLVAVFGYRFYERSKSTDPLKDLGPGLYQPPPGGDTLPLPVVTNR